MAVFPTTNEFLPSPPAPREPVTFPQINAVFVSPGGASDSIEPFDSSNAVETTPFTSGDPDFFDPQPFGFEVQQRRWREFGDDESFGNSEPLRSLNGENPGDFVPLQPGDVMIADQFEYEGSNLHARARLIQNVPVSVYRADAPDFQQLNVEFDTTGNALRPSGIATNPLQRLPNAHVGEALIGRGLRQIGSETIMFTGVESDIEGLPFIPGFQNPRRRRVRASHYSHPDVATVLEWRGCIHHYRNWYRQPTGNQGESEDAGYSGVDDDLYGHPGQMLRTALGVEVDLIQPPSKPIVLRVGIAIEKFDPFPSARGKFWGNEEYPISGRIQGHLDEDHMWRIVATENSIKLPGMVAGDIIYAGAIKEDFPDFGLWIGWPENGMETVFGIPNGLWGITHNFEYVALPNGDIEVQTVAGTASDGYGHIEIGTKVGGVCYWPKPIDGYFRNRPLSEWEDERPKLNHPITDGDFTETGPCFV